MSLHLTMNSRYVNNYIKLIWAHKAQSLSTFLAKLEEYADLEVDIIRNTKIHKVLRAIIRLDWIPQDDKVHNFKKRSHELLTAWNPRILAADPSGGAADKDDEKEDGKIEPKAANGEKAGDVDKDDAKAEKVKDVTNDNEPKASGALAEDNDTSKIGTGVEGEKEAEKPAETAPAEAGTNGDAPDVEKAPAEAYVPPPEEAAA